MSRGDVVIASRVIQWLRADDAADRFARYLAEGSDVTPLEAAGLGTPAQETPDARRHTDGGIEDKSRSDGERAPASRKLKRYPINIAIPQQTRVVTDEVPLQRGARLGCSWGSKWYPVTVMEVHDDGAVRIRWETFGDAWDADVPRGDLVIAERVLRILDRRAASAESSPRKWSDSSGEFTVMARFVDFDNGVVRLRKPSGQETQVPIEKLSELDRRWVEQKVGARSPQGENDQ